METLCVWTFVESTKYTVKVRQMCGDEQGLVCWSVRQLGGSEEGK